MSPVRFDRRSAPLPPIDSVRESEGEESEGDAANDAPTAPAMVVGEAAVGDRVEAVQRALYTQEGVTRYGFKVRSVD